MENTPSPDTESRQPEEYVRPGTCVWRMRNGHGCGRDAVRFLRVVPGEPRWYVCGIHAAVALKEMGRG